MDTWKTVRQDTAQAVEDLPAGELDFKPVPEVASFGEIARHILDASHALTGMLLAGEEHFNAPDVRDKMKQHMTALPEKPDARTLASELRNALDQRCAQLAAQPPEFFARLITRMDGQRVTRLELIQFVKEHELTHRAQLFLYLRMKGIVPPTTRRRQTKK